MTETERRSAGRSLAWIAIVAIAASVVTPFARIAGYHVLAIAAGVVQVLGLLGLALGFVNLSVGMRVPPAARTPAVASE